ncbi:SCO family protein [Nodularia spumigena]|uniref:SCO family protein n=1 Tax=Nodularia spumigena TaxID=70799 RepID=UPI002B21C451|nr:SCO family protein [Nodularia spumigena]MEA5614501.1 SCO family protein [Nodularia spumigena UHCC 0040]
MSRADRPIPILRPLFGVLTTLLAVGAVALPVSHAPAQLILPRDQVAELQGVDIEERLNSQIPLDAVFTNDRGETVTLGDSFGDGKPAILALVYYECPVVCTIVLDKLLESLNQLEYTAGEDYRLLVVSFDHREGTTQAQGKKYRFLTHYNRPVPGPAAGVADGIAFHTGDKANIERLTEAVGFQFAPLANGEWSHAAGITILSPDGRVMRYLYGYSYPSDQLKLSLLDATDGKIARSLGERIMHFCFRYDPTAGAYSLEAMALMRLGGVVTVVLLTVLIVCLLIGERVRRRLRGGASPLTESNLGDDRGSSRAGRRPVTPAGQVS